MQMGRCTVVLTGWEGAPGVNVIHWATMGHLDIDGEAWADFRVSLHQAYADSSGALVSGVHVTIPQDCHVLEVSTGDLVGVVHDDAVLNDVVGTGAGSLSRATQILVQFHTGDVRNNRLVRGRLNLGPAPEGAFTSAGQVVPAFRTNLALAWNLIADPFAARVGIWSRPSSPGASDGQFSDVTSTTIWDKPAVLRSRRD